MPIYFKMVAFKTASSATPTLFSGGVASQNFAGFHRAEVGGDKVELRCPYNDRMITGSVTYIKGAPIWESLFPPTPLPLTHLENA
jgi:hypothetical protein